MRRGEPVAALGAVDRPFAVKVIAMFRAWSLAPVVLLLAGCSYGGAPIEPSSSPPATSSLPATSSSPVSQSVASSPASAVAIVPPVANTGREGAFDPTAAAVAAEAVASTERADPSAAQVASSAVDAESSPVATTAAAPAAEWRSLLDRVDPARDAVAGTWSKTSEGLRVGPATGARLSIPEQPTGEYDVRVTATRVNGQHSVAVFLPHGAGQVSFEVDAWGRHLGGLQNVGGRSMQENATRQENVALENGKRFVMTVEVRADSIRALLDGQVVATYQGDGSDLSVPDLWRMPDRASLGVGAWESETVFHAIEIRAVGSGDAIASAASPAKPAEAASPATVVAASPAPTALASNPSEPSAPKGGSAAGKRVLIVIANYDFFYREYGDPRQELERAGVEVTVAAGRRGRCTPHGGSGQGPDGGVVQADVAIADAKADDYDAILFSGGWGASAYQFAFEGRYDQAQYNGERATKVAVNRLIGDFLEQDKYVAALCNGVTVLAWARVDGESPLAGKAVCAPQREAAPGIYDGQRAQPPCRWHAERNGALMAAPGSIGRPGTAEDDVFVDGKIVTGEDDISAREMGRRLVLLLSS